jgi:hypothetical protein
VDESRILNLELSVKTLTEVVSNLNWELLKVKKSLIEFESKQTKKQPGMGVPVWDAYLKAFVNRYDFEPVRNAKVNRNCSDIAKRLGADAPAVTAFYVGLNDPSWVRLNHPIGVLLVNCESIYSMWKQGGIKSISTARADERRGDNMNASREYLNRKHGGPK